MSEDWKQGDLAVCVNRAEIACEFPCKHTAAAVTNSDGALRVVSVRPSTITEGRSAGLLCGCTELVLADGSRGIVQRFRKIKPDTTEPCEEEFITLLKRAPAKVA